MNFSLRLLAISVSCLQFGLGDLVHADETNLFPNPNFDKFEPAPDFEGELPTGWSVNIWNQPAVKEKIHSLEPGWDGKGSCIEIEATTPIAYTTLTSPAVIVSANQDYLFKGNYASTCQGVTRNQRWIDAEGVVLSGNWLDADKNSIKKFKFSIVLPETQDRWIEFYQEVRSPEAAQELQIVITRRWVGGRLRFDDFSLRKGKIRDYVEEFSIRQVPDEEFFPIYAILPPSRRQMEKGSNIDSDLHHSQYALANFNLGRREGLRRKPGFGVKYFLEGGLRNDDSALAALDKDPMFWWVFGGDEPHTDAFPGLAKDHERIRRLVPSKPFWMNLLPTYGFASLEEYDKHIKAYIETVKPTMLTYDHYCMVGSDPHINAKSWYSPNKKGDYFPNLEIVRKHALESNIDFGVIVSVGTFAGVRGASEAELRWQAYTTLAYGARSLGWFTYVTESSYGNWTNWEDMVINRDGTRTRHYSMLKYLNGEVLAWGRTLLQLQSTGAYHTEPLPPMTRSIKESRLVESISGGLCLVGEFKSQKDGRKYMMLVNKDFIEPKTFQLKFRKSPDTLLEVSKQTGQKQAALGYSRSTGELEIEFAAGDGRLFCFE